MSQALAHTKRNYADFSFSFSSMFTFVIVREKRKNEEEQRWNFPNLVIMVLK